MLFLGNWVVLTKINILVPIGALSVLISIIFIIKNVKIHFIKLLLIYYMFYTFKEL
jgi:hypothetical protein